MWIRCVFLCESIMWLYLCEISGRQAKCLAESSLFALCSQPHRRRIDPPDCSALQSHQCNQTSAAINHRLRTLCPACCHTHLHKHTHARKLDCECTNTEKWLQEQTHEHRQICVDELTHSCCHTHWCTLPHSQSFNRGTKSWVVVLQKLELSAQGA